MTLPTEVAAFSEGELLEETGTWTTAALSVLRDALNRVLQAPLRRLLLPVLLWDFEASGTRTKYNLRDVAGRTRIAFRIIPPYTAGIVGLDLELTRTGTPTGNIWLTIMGEDGSSLPNDQVIAESNHLAIDALSTTFQRVHFSFAVPAYVKANQQISVVFNGDYTVSAANFASVDFYNFGAITWPEATQHAQFDSGTGLWTAAASPLGVLLGFVLMALDLR